MRDALIAACKAEAIEHTTTTSRVQLASEQDVVPISLTRNWPSQYCIDGEPRAYTRPAQFKDVTHYHIAAPVFAAWLAAQGVEPNTHIAAWFKALGVVPAVDGAGTGGGRGDEVFLLKDFAALVVHRAENKGAAWATGNQLEILRAEHERLGGAAAALETLAAALGTTRQNIGKVIDADRKRSRLPSSGTVHAIRSNGR